VPLLPLLILLNKDTKATEGVTMNHTSRSLYKLKRRFATSVTLNKKSNITTNTKTGRKSFELKTITIRQAIVMPARNYRTFVYDLAFISANKDFTTGGYFDPNDRRVVIDKKDIPSDWVITNDQYLVIKNKHYQILEIQDNESAYSILGKMLRGECSVIGIPVISVLTLDHSSEGTLNV